MRLHGKAAEATACFEALARSGDPYMMAEGYWGLEDYQKAKQEFEIAVGRPNSPALWHVRYGMLFHERFNDEDAAKLYNEALLIDPAKRELMMKKEELEQKIDELKYEKAAMEPGEYTKELRAALVELAQVQGELDK